MEPLTIFSWIIYVILLFVAFVSPTTVEFNGRPVQNPLARLALVALMIPITGFIFWLLGFVGKFMLLPITSLF